MTITKLTLLPSLQEPSPLLVKAADESLLLDESQDSNLDALDDSTNMSFETESTHFPEFKPTKKVSFGCRVGLTLLEDFDLEIKIKKENCISLHAWTGKLCQYEHQNLKKRQNIEMLCVTCIS